MNEGRRLVRVAAIAGLAATLVVTVAWRAFAHEIPADVTVVAFVKPDGDRLRLVVRVPLAAIR
ncbi:MAG: hypothetical protein ACRELX_11330, partial [Longimicrobiales bacterium]